MRTKMIIFLLLVTMIIMCSTCFGVRIPLTVLFFFSVTTIRYRWGSGVADHVSYEAGSDVVDYQIAFGALPNHHCLLDKLDYVYPQQPYDDSLVDRFQDPGAGAFTYVGCLVLLVSSWIPTVVIYD